MKLRIRGKLLLALFVVALAVFAAMGYISIHDLRQMREDALRYGLLIGTSAIGDSKTALQRAAELKLGELAKDQAKIVDLKLGRAADQLNAAAGFQLIPEHLRYAGDRMPDGLFYAPGCETPAQKTIAMKLHPYRDILRFIDENTKYISLAYLALPDGLYLQHPAHNPPDGYDARARKWYREAVAGHGKVCWSAPYPSATENNRIILTCSKAIYGTDGQLCGVLAADIAMDYITENIIHAVQDSHASIYLVNEQGKVVADDRLNEAKSDWTHEELNLESLLTPEDRAAIKAGGNVNMPHILHREVRGVMCFVACAPVPSAGWTVAVSCPEAVILQSAISTEGKIRDMIVKASAGYEIFIDAQLKLFLGVSLGILVLVLILGYVLSEQLTTSIRKLREWAGKIGSGELDSPASIKSGDEIEELADTIQKMSRELKEYIRNLKSATAAREKIESELQVARGIQMSILPSRKPVFEGSQRLSIESVIRPAREVGGDLYDYLPLEDGRLFFCIGDVSGKGAPAALFMAVADTLMKAMVRQHDMPPSRVMLLANNYLEQGNESCMFVTACGGIIDPVHGNLQMCSAGHNPPVLMRADGSLKILRFPPAPPLGCIPQKEGVYQDQPLKLHAGDRVFLYTDGVTEAMNAARECFGMNKLLDVLRGQKPDADQKETIEAVLRAVKEHSGKEAQSDDITMLMIRYNGPEGKQ